MNLCRGLLRLRASVYVIGALLFLFGCHSLTIVPREGNPASASPISQPDHFNRQGSVVFGIKSVSPAVDVTCGRANAEVRIVTGFLDSVIHFFIGPAYTTKSVEVYCKK